MSELIKDKGSIKFPKKGNQKQEDEILSFLFNVDGAKAFNVDYFRSLFPSNVPQTGTILYHMDNDFHLLLNNMVEAKFLHFLVTSGLPVCIRGQTLEVPYVKPWASNKSPYYPDFAFIDRFGRIAIIEVKSILGMCQDENIVKYEYLYSFCKRNGFMGGFIDADHLPFSDYLWPVGLDKEEEKVKATFNRIVASSGGFNQSNLEYLSFLFPSIKEKELKRYVSMLILQDPYLENRYCHDSPYLVNAVKIREPLAYKKFS